MNEKQININIDLSKIENMKCICGEEAFLSIVNLKWISPIQCGNPEGVSVQVQKFMCANMKCRRIYEKAMPADDVEKLYGAGKNPDRWGIVQNEEAQTKNKMEIE